MDVSIQYLEGTPRRAGITAPEARGRLRAAFDRVNFKMVMLGWDLQPEIIEACAEECGRHGAELYLWQPILSGHGSFPPHPSWRVIALDGGAAGGATEPAEFTFMCPNRPEVLENVLRTLSAALSGGCFQGVFLDRIRLPSPASSPARHLGCFCKACREAARRLGFDLDSTRQDLVIQFGSDAGRRAALGDMLGGRSESQDAARNPMRRLMDFRSASISRFVKAVTEALKAQSLKVGLDCYSPTLMRMVGQDLPALAADVDWIKVMTYARAIAHASIPFELLGLADWLMAARETEGSALSFLSEATGWSLPLSGDVVRRGGLPATILTQELRRGREPEVQRLLAGIEVLEMPDVSKLNRRQIRTDAAAVRAGEPDGVVLSWDLWHMPEWRLELAASLYAER